MRLRYRLTAAAFGAIVWLGSVSPAEADMRRFADPHGDTTSTMDIWSVRLDNSTANRRKVIVATRHEDLFGSGRVMVYLDTRPADPGPEYLYRIVMEVDVDFRHAETWTNLGAAVGCPGERLFVSYRNPDRARITIPRSCLGRPGKVRVAVHATSPSGAADDWAKARRSWLRWVPR